jgi:hypothetical protein
MGVSGRQWPEGHGLAHAGDQMFRYDHSIGGKLDHVLLYRSGEGTIWVLKNSGGACAAALGKES